MTHSELFETLHPKINMAAKATEGFIFIVTSKVLKNLEIDFTNYIAKQITASIKDTVKQISNILEHRDTNINESPIISGENTCSIDDAQ